MKLLIIASALLAIAGATDGDSTSNTEPTNKASDINEDSDGKPLLHARFSDNPKRGIPFSEKEGSLAKRALYIRELVRRQGFRQIHAQDTDAIYSDTESTDSDSDDDDDCEEYEDDDQQSGMTADLESAIPARTMESVHPAETGIPVMSNTGIPAIIATPTATTTATETPTMSGSVSVVTQTVTSAMDTNDDDEGYYGGEQNGGNCCCCCGGGPGFGIGPPMFAGYQMGGMGMMGGGMGMGGGMMNSYLNMQQGGFPGGGVNNYYYQNGGQGQGQGGFNGYGQQNGYGPAPTQAPVLEITETIQSIGYETILVTEDIAANQGQAEHTSIAPVGGGYSAWGYQNGGQQDNGVSYVYVPYPVTVGNNMNGGNGQFGMPSNSMGFDNPTPTNSAGSGGFTPTGAVNNNVLPTSGSVQLFGGEDSTGSPFGEDNTGSMKPFGEEDNTQGSGGSKNSVPIIE
ncbi:hypothetical protein H4R24_003343 [Coemansia sp. RSA 988]|nr:hypothetical protein H4R24_003343 [Coemansia sp. RSA 988]